MIENAWVAWLILLLPLAAFVIIGLLGRWLRDGSGYVAVAAMLGSLVLSLYVFVQVLAQGAIGGNFAAQTIAGYVWLPSIPGNEIRISLLIDNLSSLMLVLVSFLCLLIFIYSLGYMHEEEGKPRYYAEVSLFATGMLGTVSADNFLQLLIFWEIMGLCSYLLIGFWYHKTEAAAAAKKASLVTRAGRSPALQGDSRDRGHRGLHHAVRGVHGRRQQRHQAGPRLVHDFSARVHVSRTRRRGVCHGDGHLPERRGELCGIQCGPVR